MGRIINETDSSTIADADYLLKDNATSGTTKWSGANLKAQLEIVARKGVASGYCALDSDSLVPAANLRPAFTIEEVADATARDALTITSGEVGKRLVRLTDTGVIYLANATGSGSSKWTVFNSMATATTAGQGVVELATATEARDVQGASASLVPSVSAMQAAIAALRNGLAPRQGLVFDGTAGATVANIPAFGTGDYTVVAWAKPAAIGTQQYITLGGAGSAGFRINADGTIASVPYGSGAVATSSGVLVANKHTMLVSVRSSGTATLYRDTVADGSGADATNYASGITDVGSLAGGSAFWNGFLRVLIYNRALSAAEVLALYESGAPAAADYPAAIAGTNLSTATFDATLWGSSFSAFTGASATGFHAERAAAGGDDNVATAAFAVKKGDVIRCVFDLTNSADLPSIYLGETTSGAAMSAVTATTAGTAQIFDLTATAAGTVRVAFYTGNALAANYTVANFTAKPLGLLCATESNGSGVGPQVRDVSGNAAHINLPGDGVSGGVTHALPGGSHGDFGETRTASGYALGRDAVVIPEGYRIARIWCTGDGTFSIGNAAAGTEVVNAFTATGTVQPATLAAYTTSSRKLYLTLGTANTVTYAVHLERV